ncbi:manganese efflux pump [Paenibacillus cisolokensis]|uniref:manganese efflux pump MntP n=1 Tax=Paenibacillus cisolokensis TaxID=1658519 RepID=UPI003D2E365E
MQMASVHSGQLATILMMAFALGLDAFSLGIGMGMRGIRWRHVLMTSLLIAVFHMILPMLGMMAGRYMGLLLGQVTGLAAGGLLALLGMHMIYNAFRGGGQVMKPTAWFGMLLFSLSVSMDSFSVGLSLGMVVNDMVLIALSFGVVGGLMSVLGLTVGRQVSGRLSEYGEMLGGIILFVFGLMFIF